VGSALAFAIDAAGVAIGIVLWQLARTRRLA
jgi:hypothetical protein